MGKRGIFSEVSAPKFYCKKYCGDPGFSIHEWNDAFDLCNKLGIEGEERDKILFPVFFPCDNQCNNCIDTVLDTQIGNRKLGKE